MNQPIDERGGSLVRLLPLDRSHGPETRRWLLDPDVRERVGTVRPPSEFEHEAWMQRQSTDPASVVRVVECDGSLVGMAGLRNIDLISSHAEIWLYLVSSRRGGVGRAALQELLDHGFDTMGLHRIHARVFGFNEPAAKFFRSCGFTGEGSDRDGVFKRGRFHDVFRFGMLADEWRQR